MGIHAVRLARAGAGYDRLSRAVIRRSRAVIIDGGNLILSSNNRLFGGRWIICYWMSQEDGNYSTVIILIPMGDAGGCIFKPKLIPIPLMFNTFLSRVTPGACVDLYTFLRPWYAALTYV